MGDEAVQLTQDRARDERGIFRRVRLLMDLAIDLGATSLRGWHTSPHGSRESTAHGTSTPSTPRVRPAALAVGVVASILMFAAFPLLFQPEAVANASADAREAARGEPHGAHRPVRRGGRLAPDAAAASAPGGAPAASPFDDLPDISTVLDRLGLELKQQDAAVLVYKVRRIEPPASK